MKALITKTSDWEYLEIKDVETIDDALSISNRLVLSKMDDSDKEIYPNSENCEIKIEIYDDWRE